jgi:Ni2+-binding GTPase involved in maturation of urease and hydrogenase
MDCIFIRLKTNRGYHNSIAIITLIHSKENLQQYYDKHISDEYSIMIIKYSNGKPIPKRVFRSYISDNQFEVIDSVDISDLNKDWFEFPFTFVNKNFKLRLNGEK